MYKEYSEFLKEQFPDFKVQKISVNAGFSCPNRTGESGRGGCIYCNNTSFTPKYCFDTRDIAAQIEAGKSFFARKYPEMKYLAYFQSYSNTYDCGLEELERLYRSALEIEDVVGLIVGTRPDCLPREVVEMLGRLSAEYKVFVELGAESSHNRTLTLINRGHSWEETVDAVERLAQAGISVGLHLIAGLPGETAEDLYETIRRVMALPVDTIKLHHLQVLRGTPLLRMVENGEIEIHPLSMEEYMEMCEKIVNLVPRKIAIERFLASSPPEMVVMPKWGIKNFEFVNLLKNRLKKKKNNI